MYAHDTTKLDLCEVHDFGSVESARGTLQCRGSEWPCELRWERLAGLRQLRRP